MGKIGITRNEDKTERQKKYLIFRGVAGCPVVLLPSCLSGFLSMCKKMAHSAQLNIKVDPPFFGWLFGWAVGWLAVGVPHLVGCRVSWPWPGVVPLDRVLQVWPGVACLGWLWPEGGLFVNGFIVDFQQVTSAKLAFFDACFLFRLKINIHSFGFQ